MVTALNIGSYTMRCLLFVLLALAFVPAAALDQADADRLIEDLEEAQQELKVMSRELATQIEATHAKLRPLLAEKGRYLKRARQEQYPRDDDGDIVWPARLSAHYADVAARVAAVQKRLKELQDQHSRISYCRERTHLTIVALRQLRDDLPAPAPAPKQREPKVEATPLF